MTECCQVTTTVDAREVADRLAAQMVEERLAACAQVQGPIASVYRWQGAVERATEWYCRFIAVPIVSGDPAYLAWIEEGVRR